jgi:hypothetical protein
MAKKIAIILLVFVCFYLGAHFYIRWKNRVTDDVSKVTQLVACDANEVRGIKIFTSKGDKESELSFVRVDQPGGGVPPAAQLAASEWKYESPLTGEADATAMIRFASMFCEIYDPAPTRDEEYAPGAAPVDRVVFDLGSKGIHTLRFGKTAEERMVVTRYEGPDGSSRTVKIPPKIMQLASQEPKLYLNTRVMRMTADNINVATVYRGDKESFSLERQGDGWKILIDGKEVGPGSEEAQKFVNRLSTLKAIKVDAEALSPTNCERAQSRMSVELEGVGGREEAIFFQYKPEGKGKGKPGDITVCNTARDALFTVHRDLIPYLEVPVEKLKAN